MRQHIIKLEYIKTASQPISTARESNVCRHREMVNETASVFCKCEMHVFVRMAVAGPLGLGLSPTQVISGLQRPLGGSPAMTASLPQVLDPGSILSSADMGRIFLQNLEG